MSLNKILALGIFVLSYLLFIIFPKHRHHVAVLGMLTLIALGILSVAEAFRLINWNVMGIFIGTLIVAELFTISRMPAVISEWLVRRTSTLRGAILMICFLTGLLSMITENIATVLIMAPIAISLSQKFDISPTKFLIALSISSNLQGTATLLGDPPSIILGGYTGMTFNDFFFYHGRPSIFFIVEVGAFFSFLVLFWIFRHDKAKIQIEPTEKLKNWAPTVLLALLILALVGTSFTDEGMSYLPGVICIIFGVLGILWYAVTHREDCGPFIRKLDWETLIFLGGVFIIVGSLTAEGWIESAASVISNLVGQQVLGAFIVIILTSVAISAFVDNTPFLIAMIPIGQQVAGNVGISPELLLFGLLIGTTLGGNITPIGASANIVAFGQIRRQGISASFGEFARIGVPFTAAAVTSAAIFLWFVWA